MRQIKSAWELGATMYIPAIHRDLIMILARKKPISGSQQPRTLVICLEDAIKDEQLEEALDSLEVALESYRTNEQFVFVRPKNENVLSRILKIKNIDKVDGFVLPKITADNIDAYLTCLDSRMFYIMPTLETRECFDKKMMLNLRDKLLPHKDKVVTLRIGGNDLLNTLHMRRPKNGTLYDTPVGLAIHSLVHVFKPYGFYLSAPVFEFTDRMNMLEKEVEFDLMAGLVGKTAIHPDQLHHIEKHFEVCEKDYEMAMAILDPTSPAVFQMYGSMCEPATHRAWAKEIVARYNVFNNKN